MMLDEDGATAIEYSIIAACIVLVLLVALLALRAEVIQLWDGNTNSITDGLK